MWRYGPKGPALLECGKNQRDYLRRKRMLDVVLSLLALVALSPVLVAISLLIVIDDPRGGPIFCQKRREGPHLPNVQISNHVRRR